MLVRQPSGVASKRMPKAGRSFVSRLTMPLSNIVEMDVTSLRGGSPRAGRLPSRCRAWSAAPPGPSRSRPGSSWRGRRSGWRACCSNGWTACTSPRYAVGGSIRCARPRSVTGRSLPPHATTGLGECAGHHRRRHPPGGGIRPAGTRQQGRRTRLERLGPAGRGGRHSRDRGRRLPGHRPDRRPAPQTSRTPLLRGQEEDKPKIGMCGPASSTPSSVSSLTWWVHALEPVAALASAAAASDSPRTEEQRRQWALPWSGHGARVRCDGGRTEAAR